MIRVKRLLLVSVISLFLGGCIPIVTDSPQDTDSVQDTDTPQDNKYINCTLPETNNQISKSDTTNIAIHIDGSGSMLGYVSSKISRYIQTLDLLDRTLSLGGSQNLEYYRVGRGIEALTRPKFLKAQKQEFYSGLNPQFPNVESDIAAAITPPPEDREQLIVIVTDLYQNEADVTRINRKIQEHYLNSSKPGYAAGILAVRSEFNGKVYVQESRNIEFTYNTQDRASEEFRPFYIIFIGPYSKIVSYFNEFNRTELLEESEENQYEIFSPNQIVNKMLYINKHQGRLPEKGIKSRNSLNNGKVRVELKYNQPIELLEIGKNIDEELEIQHNVDFANSKYSLPLDPNFIEYKINAEVYDRFYKDFKEDENAINVLEIDKNEANFVTKIKPREFTEPGIYYFTVDVRAKGLKESSWWRDWNWNSTRDELKDGSKTDRLLSFLQGLKSITNNLVAKNPPVIGRFCYAIQKN
ncbi:MAG: hypothetical protein F6K58_11265 [Symploca sp. SIO2E9]|nr:hypothetical protein [Symploca sp. SIO2E9]